MDRLPNVVIVMARCAYSRQAFGIRFEEKRRHQWTADWAFAIKEAAAKREGYDKGEIIGEFSLDGVYPGCPHCGASHIVKCGVCGKAACWDGLHSTVTCPWCGSTGQIGGYIESLDTSSDR